MCMYNQVLSKNMNSVGWYLLSVMCTASRFQNHSFPRVSHEVTIIHARRYINVSVPYPASSTTSPTSYFLSSATRWQMVMRSRADSVEPNMGPRNPQ